MAKILKLRLTCLSCYTDSVLCVCSNCGESISHQLANVRLDQKAVLSAPYKFCPYCGEGLDIISDSELKNLSLRNEL